MTQSRSYLRAVCGAFLGAALAAAAGLAQSEERRDLNRETFDRAWELVGESYWDPEMGGLDWGGVRDELGPRAERAVDDEELRDVIREMLARLGQSHFGVIPGSAGAGSGEDEEADPDNEALTGTADCDGSLRAELIAVIERGEGSGALGLELLALPEGLLVSAVRPGEPAERAGIEPGWRVRSLGQFPEQVLVGCLGEGLDEKARDYAVRRALAALLSGEPGSRLVLVLEDDRGELRELELERRRPKDVERVGFGNLPEMDFRFDTEWIETPSSIPVASIAFNAWLMPVAARFQSAIVDMAHAGGVVIDLRDNPGGIGGLSMGIAGYFLDEPVSLGTMKTRQNHLEFRANPRLASDDGRKLEIFGRPLAILVDGGTASTSEIFAAGLQDLGRARIFGQPTMAAALPSLIERLPNGDLLMHAIADFERPNGKRVEGEGVQPDQLVVPTREGLLAGRDEPLDAALRWIDEQTSSAGMHRADSEGSKQ